MDRLITSILTEAGFETDAEQSAARAALEEAGLTRPGKQSMSDEKIDRVGLVLASRFSFACPACIGPITAARPDATVLPVDDDRCDGCGGSDHQVAANRFLDACRTHGVRSVAVVGGTPVTRQALVPLLPGIALERVDGTGQMNAQKARSIIERSDLVIVWGKTQLDHKVSNLFTAPQDKWKVVVAAKRGAAGLLDAGRVHLERR